MRHLGSFAGRHHTIYTIYLMGFFLALEISIPAYLNSSFLSTLFTENKISLIYILASLFSIISLFLIHKSLKSIGCFRTVSSIIIIQAFVFFGLIKINEPIYIALLFIMMTALFYLQEFTFDVLLESNSKDTETGGIRGSYLTVISLGWLMSPIIAGTIASVGSLRVIYISSLLLLAPLIYLVYKNFNHFKDRKYSNVPIKPLMIAVWRHSDMRNVFSVNLILQSFYAWMVIYTPIYLNQIIGLGWDKIGLIFFIMLIPFVILDAPLGRLADRRFGEKEIMAFGFIFMGLATTSLYFISSTSVIVWAILLFGTRIGAASIEVMIETYFFKKIHTRDTNLLSLFRMTRPSAYFIAPLIMIIVSGFVDMRMMFMVIGLLGIIGAPIAMRLHDTR